MAVYDFMSSNKIFITFYCLLPYSCRVSMCRESAVTIPELSLVPEVRRMTLFTGSPVCGNQEMV